MAADAGVGSVMIVVMEPAVKQIKVHPYLTQDHLRAFSTSHGLITEASSPIAQGGALNDPTIMEIAERADRSAARVTLRRHVQRGDVVFRKSVTRNRVAGHFALVDTEVWASDVAAITDLCRDQRSGSDPDTFTFIPKSSLESDLVSGADQGNATLRFAPAPALFSTTCLRATVATPSWCLFTLAASARRQHRGADADHLRIRRSPMRAVAAGWNQRGVPMGSGSMSRLAVRRSAVITGGMLLLAACSPSPAETSNGSSRVEALSQGPAAHEAGAQATAFTATTLDGAELDVATFGGSPLVLWFWAPWCTICRAEGPDVARVAADLEGQVTFLGVPGLGSEEDMRAFVEDTDTSGFTHVVDADGSVWRRFGVVYQPAFAFIDPGGTVEIFAGALGEDGLRDRAGSLVAGGARPSGPEDP